MRKRDEVYHVYEDLRRKFRDKIKCINTVVSEYDDEIKRMQCDNGKEYEKLARIIVKYGNFFRFTQAYTPLPDERQHTCGCHHCDDCLAQATASVEATLRAEDAATKERTRRQRRQTGEVIISRSSGVEPIDTQSANKRE
ncbi:hypothetical protein PF005_g18545 [Phytophthora fragariae]|nr:hypothetical protein PF005_g18545 [Phytophthora fragariae]KAE9202272.1 hypothetical protein PF004_g18467 [Phytophthora fragariae]